MDFNELQIEIDQIPIITEEVIANIDLMIQHAIYLRQKSNDLSDDLVIGLLETAPPFIEKQLNRLKICLDDETDIIAWLSRSLIELFFILKYMYTGRNQYEEVIREQLNDLKDIESIIYPEGVPVQDSPEEIQSFHNSMKNLWSRVQQWGIVRKTLKRPKQAYHFAKGANLEQHYKNHWKIHSKYIHPTSYLLFGRREFVYGDGAKNYFIKLVQYYAGLNLRDLHKMILAIPPN